MQEHKIISPRRIPKWVWALAIIVLIAAVNVVMALVNFVTANPTSCLSCHGTGGTPDMSKASQLHPGYSEVRCVDCHAKPGQYVLVEGYRGGFSADPPKLSASCIRCHADMPSKEGVEAFKFNSLEIEISHKAHLERGASCTDCHQNVAHDPSPEPTNRPRMESCYQCHSRDTSCTKCHGTSVPLDESFSLPWTPPVKPVSSTPPAVPHSIDGRAECLACHQTGAAGATKVPVSHTGRTNDLCSACHQPPAKPATPGTNATTVPGREISTTTSPPTTPTQAVGGPPEVPHNLDGRSPCLACHETGIGGATRLPPSHGGRTNEMCLLCHKR